MSSNNVMARDAPTRPRPSEDPLTALREQEVAIARAQGERTRMLASLALTGSDNESLPGELASELGCSLGTARHKLEQASELCERLPATVENLCTGNIDWDKAVAMADITRPLSSAQSADVEEWTLQRAANKPYAAFTACARQRVHRADPGGGGERARSRRADRRVQLRPLDEGVSELVLRLPAELAIGAWQRVESLARQARAADDTRPIAMVRADVTADLLLGEHTTSDTNTGSGTGVRGDDTADIATLLEVCAEPATLHGYAPVDVDPVSIRS